MLQKLYSWYGKKTVMAVAVVALALVGGGLLRNALITTNTTVVNEEEVVNQVKAMAISELGELQKLSVIGTVESQAEATLLSEVSGRIVSVPVELGQSVTTGQMIARFENSREQASVLQAEGVYEAALASGIQSDTALEEARNAVTSAKLTVVGNIQASFSLAENIVLNQIDQFFSNPYSTTPGLRLTGTSYTSTLNAERVNLQTSLPAFKDFAQSVTTESDLTQAVNKTQAELRQIRDLVSILITIFNDNNINTYTTAELRAFSTEFTTLRNSLNSQITALDSALITVKNSQDTLNRLQLGSSDTEISAVNAQIKQALGSLRGAQSLLAKTSVRAPFSGKVTDLSVSIGDFVSAFSPVATIANDGIQQVTVFLTDQQATQVSIGDSVVVNDSVQGEVKLISPVVSPSNGKREVVVDLDQDTKLTSGQTARVQFSLKTTDTVGDNTSYLVPIEAVRFKADSAYVFTVEDSRLVEVAVNTRTPSGNLVRIDADISPSTLVVQDARGLVTGTMVTVEK